MSVPVSVLALVAAGLALASPTLAAPTRGYDCTNIMGGNPFRLTIFEDGSYITAPHAGTLVPKGMDGGKLQLSETGHSYTVLSGPLFDELAVATIHIMSPTSLVPSGSSGMFDCTKAK